MRRHRRTHRIPRTTASTARAHTAATPCTALPTIAPNNTGTVHRMRLHGIVVQVVREATDAREHAARAAATLAVEGDGVGVSLGHHGRIWESGGHGWELKAGLEAGEGVCVEDALVVVEGAGSGDIAFGRCGYGLVLQVAVVEIFELQV